MQNNNIFRLLEHKLYGINLIEASAGTGKTYTINGLFLRLLIERKEIDINDILVVTFSEAATEELKDRIRNGISSLISALNGAECNDEFLKAYTEIIGEEGRIAALDKLKRALINFDEANIFTIHSFCRRMLNENAFESGILFDVELIKDESDIKREIVEDFWRRHIITLPVYLIRYLQRNPVDSISFNSLLKLAERIEDLTDIKLIPQDEFDSTGSAESFDIALKAIRNTWKQHSSEIKNIFTNKDVFNQVKYKADKIAGILDRLDQYLSGNEIPEPYFKDLGLFTYEAVIKGVKAKQTPPKDEFGFFAQCRELLEAQEAFRIFIPCLKRNFFRFVVEELSKRKHIKNVQSFSDLLLNLHNALSEGQGNKLAEKIRSKYKAALIDEFQDTDPVQFGIFEKIFSGDNTTLFMIGDPKQAIYGFRGADIFAYLKASQEAKYDKWTLGTNFRSQPDLIEAVNLIFDKEDSFVFKEISYSRVTAPPEDVKPPKFLIVEGQPYSPMRLWKINRDSAGEVPEVPGMNNEDLVSACLAGEIRRLLDLGRQKLAVVGDEPLMEKDFAVLVRKNSQAEKVQKSLIELGIPCVIYNSGNIFSSHEAEEAERLLSCIADPGNIRLVKAALATDLLGLSCLEIDELTEDEQQFEAWLEKFREYNRIWYSSGFIRMLRKLLNDENILPRLMEFLDGERRNTNVLHLMELLHQAETGEKLSPRGLIKWLQENISSENDKEEHQLRLESDEKAVKIITIHKSKGLEYPVVFIPFMWSTFRERKEFLFHKNENNSYQRTWELGSQLYDLHRAIHQRENLAEDLRLLYVAITRARNCCYLVLNEELNGVLEHLFSDLKSLQESSAGCINIGDMPISLSPAGSPPSADELPELKPLDFSGTVSDSSRIASYTSLLYGHANVITPVEQELLPEDELTDENESMDAELNEFSIYSFYKGQRAGIFMHEILEEADFSAGDFDELVKAKLNRYRFDEAYAPALNTMVKNVLSARLAGTLSLQQVPSQKRLREMEFYFPLKTINVQKLAAIFKESYAEDERLNDFYLYMEKLRFGDIGGFMNGKIDLFFEHDGRYFIADWKSNHMGSTAASYNQDNLLRLMKEGLYILQYHLYCLAIDQHLKATRKDYDYDRHFGGIFYVFLRGVDAASGQDNGIFCHRPSKEALFKLSSYLIDSADTSYE
ncbi:MAG: exodeoxyribonuclease V subunit beta [Bacteroidota bacterium]